MVHQEGAADFIDANPAIFDGHPSSLLAPNDLINRYIADQSNEDFGIFGEVTFDLTDTLTLAAGGRYFDTSSETTVSRLPGALFMTSFDPVGRVLRSVAREPGAGAQRDRDL